MSVSGDLATFKPARSHNATTLRRSPVPASQLVPAARRFGIGDLLLLSILSYPCRIHPTAFRFALGSSLYSLSHSTATITRCPFTPSFATSPTIRPPHFLFSCARRDPTAHSAAYALVLYTSTTSTTPTTQRTSSPNLTPGSQSAAGGMRRTSFIETQAAVAMHSPEGMIDVDEDRNGVPRLLGSPPRPKRVYRPWQHALDVDGGQDSMPRRFDMSRISPTIPHVSSIVSAPHLLATSRCLPSNADADVGVSADGVVVVKRFRRIQILGPWCPTSSPRRPMYLTPLLRRTLLGSPQRDPTIACEPPAWSCLGVRGRHADDRDAAVFAELTFLRRRGEPLWFLDPVLLRMHFPPISPPHSTRLHLDEWTSGSSLRQRRRGEEGSLTPTKPSTAGRYAAHAELFDVVEAYAPCLLRVPFIRRAIDGDDGMSRVGWKQVNGGRFEETQHERALRGRWCSLFVDVCRRRTGGADRRVNGIEYGTRKLGFIGGKGRRGGTARFEALPRGQMGRRR
ncbi:hypothetical protein R3P38DRAFT_3574600 [Favolaschia claudopus]|uniref:Uncharacterized protein n=1 Tax=Favolaschia claudopus TaxID=2862362 RepID=A0AAW0ANB9_9AGAR